MKICVLIWDYWPGLQGGAERQARLIARELYDRGQECEVLTAWKSVRWAKRQDDGGIAIHRLGLLIPLFLGIRGIVARALDYCRKAGSVQESLGRHDFHADIKFWMMAPWTWLARLNFMCEICVMSRLGRIKCDIIHLHEPSWLGGLAQFISHWIGCAVICQEATSPALPVVGYDTPFRHVWMQLRLKPRYIAMADYTVKQLVDGGVNPELIHVVPSGVQIPPEASSGIGSPNVLYVANFSQGAKWKAFDVLFEAWTLVAKRMPSAKLHAVGGGDSAEWQELLQRNDVAETVCFTGTVKDIRNYFSEASIFILPSRVEGMSSALLEAQMWGLACVVSDIPGNMAVVKNDQNGIIVPVNDVQQLADSILRLLRDADLCCRLGGCARELAIREFSIHSVGEKLISIYEGMLAKKI